MKSSYYLKTVLVISILALGLFMEPKKSFGAVSGSELEGVTNLYQDTVYQYDLNGDGIMDKLQYKVTTDEENYKTAIKLYINDTLCLSKKNDGFSYYVQILDLDKSDNHLDLYIFTQIESDGVKNPFFVQYDGTEQVNFVNFELDKLTKNFSSCRNFIDETSGDGKFTLAIDTPIFSDAIGCYYCDVPFQIKANTISTIPTKTYSLTKDSRKYQYKAAKSFSVYVKAGSKEVLYEVKKGDKVTFDKMYVSKSGKAYFRIKNSNGKKGWIKSNQENLFVERPLWG